MFFFSRSKKKRVYFFLLGKLHEPFIQDLVGFSLFYVSVGCIFFLHLCVFFLCVFFFCKSSHVNHSFDLDAVFFFPSPEKKKHSIFIHSIDFVQKCIKNELLQVKKKYDLFGLTQQKNYAVPQAQKKKKSQKCTGTRVMPTGIPEFKNNSTHFSG